MSNTKITRCVHLHWVGLKPPDLRERLEAFDSLVVKQTKEQRLPNPLPPGSQESVQVWFLLAPEVIRGKRAFTSVNFKTATRLGDIDLDGCDENTIVVAIRDTRALRNAINHGLALLRYHLRT